MRLEVVILIGLFCVVVNGGTPRGGTSGGGASSLGEYAQQIPTEIVPVEARQFYQSLTAEDKAVLQSVLNKSSSYSNVSQVLADLKNGSSVLYNKAIDVVSYFRNTIASLSEPARKFVDDTASQITNALGAEFSIAKVRAEAQAIVDRYSALSAETKEELKNAFPMVATVVYNNVFQTLASGLFGLTASEGGGGNAQGGGGNVIGGGGNAITDGGDAQGGDGMGETVPPPIRTTN